MDGSDSTTRNVRDREEPSSTHGSDTYLGVASKLQLLEDKFKDLEDKLAKQDVKLDVILKVCSENL